MALELSKDKIAGSETPSLRAATPKPTTEVPGQIGQETPTADKETMDGNSPPGTSPPAFEVLPEEYNIEALQKGSADNSSTWFGTSLARIRKVAERSR